MNAETYCHMRGLHDGAKVIEKHVAKVCVLAMECKQPRYKKLVKPLCADHNASLVTIASALGERVDANLFTHKP